MRCPHNKWFRLSDYGRVWWWHLESVIATKLARRKRVDKHDGFSLGLFTAALQSSLGPPPQAQKRPWAWASQRLRGWMRWVALGWARAHLADCQRGKVSSLSFNVELQDLVDCMCEDARPVVSTEGRNSRIPSRLHFPGFSPISRQIGRRGSVLSLPHGILDWSPS